jgi:hypothetical protein
MERPRQQQFPMNVAKRQPWKSFVLIDSLQKTGLNDTGEIEQLGESTS